MNGLQPYANLAPHIVLDAVESTGNICSGGLLALNSYENRVYQVGIEEAPPVVVKFYRPARWSNEAILEEHAFSEELSKLEIPVVAPICCNHKTLHTWEGFRFALFPSRGGRPLELDNIEHLAWMGRFIGRLHAMGACRPYQYRPRLDIETHGHRPFQFLLKNDFIPNHLKKNYHETVAPLLDQISTRFQEVGNIEYIRIHGDCHAGNILWNDQGPHIVDLDDSVMGPAIQDIWMLLSGTFDHMQYQLMNVLEGYCEFHDFNPNEVKLIEALRALRIIQYAAWIANRWEDPAFPLAFPWFNTDHYWQQHISHLTEQATLLSLPCLTLENSQ